MAIAAYFHPQSLSASQYDEAIRELEAAGAATPAGRVHHSCFGPDDALMVYEVWESQQAFDEYGPVLMPILHKAGIDPGTPDVMPVHKSRQLTRGPAPQRSWDRPGAAGSFVVLESGVCASDLVPRVRDRTVTRSWPKWAVGKVAEDGEA
jgi:hypothetical protein